jgi:hypothetical protein
MTDEPNLPPDFLRAIERSSTTELRNFLAQCHLLEKRARRRGQSRIYPKCRTAFDGLNSGGRLSVKALVAALRSEIYRRAD